MNKNLEFVPVDYDYFDFKGRNYIRMIGRDSKGRKVCVVDSYDANFYLILREGYDGEKVIEKIRNIEVEKGGRVSKVLKAEILDKKFLGESVKAVRVWVSNHKDTHEMIGKISDMEALNGHNSGEPEIDFRREWDIPLITKYIKEKRVEPLQYYNVEIGESDSLRMLSPRDDSGDPDGLDVEDIYFAESITPLKTGKEFVPKILAYDIETTGVEIGEGEILMISYCSGEEKGVVTWKDTPGIPDYVEVVKDEAEMIERFCEIVRKSDSDILTGYFSDGFDLPYLKARADYYKVVLDLGVNGRGPSFARGRIPSGKVSGLVHVDLYRFVDSVFSQYLQSESMSLNEVAGELVGAGKEDFDFARLANMKEQDWKDFFSYSLQDAAVTHKLALKLWPDVNEFCRIVKEPVFDVTRDRMATHVENHILHNLDRFDEIAERRPGHGETNERRMKRRFEGAFVFEPTPGLYEDIVMFDFTSMHSSLIVSYNISGQSLRFEAGENRYASPEFELDGQSSRVYFDKKPGFFSTLLNEIVEKRKEVKEEWKKDGSSMNRARSNAYKLLANATFGYQGFYGARYYSREAAAATLAFVRKLIHDTMDRISGAGFKIIYGDTDSIAFLNDGKSRDEIVNFLKEINKEFPGIIELDLEGFFKRGLFVAKRGSKVGAKKKYALISEDGKIKIRGFETVRRDWCGLTRKLQDEILRKVLKDGDEKGALKLVKDVVEKLKSRNVELEDLMIKTKMKREVDDYVTAGPHVAAARKMIESGAKVGVGTFVEYFIGEGSGKRVGDRVFLAGERVKYDTEYYLKKQVLPAVENIFDVFGVDVGAVVEGERQEKLF
jgi:DNA polymerase elongation subunit (family B)